MCLLRVIRGFRVQGRGHPAGLERPRVPLLSIVEIGSVALRGLSAGAGAKERARGKFREGATHFLKFGS